MAKLKDIHIRINEKKYGLVKELAKKEYRTITAVIDIALDNHLKSKKVMAKDESKK